MHMVNNGAMDGEAKTQQQEKRQSVSYYCRPAQPWSIGIHTYLGT